jgi:acyl carrier protein
MTPILGDIRQFVVDNFLFGQDGEFLDDNTSFLERGIIDSTGVLELIAFLQCRFHIRLEDEDIVPENLDSLARLTYFVQRKMSVSNVEVPS